MINFRRSSIQPSGSAIEPCLHRDFELAVVATAALKITAYTRRTGSTAFLRIKKYMFLPLLAMMMILCFPASSGEQSKTASVKSSETQPVYSLQTFKGKKIASITGTVFDKLINSVIPDVTHLYFNDYTSMTEALRLGKVDAVGVDQPVGKMLEGKCPDLMVFPLLVLNDKLGFACRKGDKLAVDAANAIEEMRRNGTMDEMAKRWLSGRDELMEIPPELEKKNEASTKGTLRFAHDNVSMPMGYSGAGGKSLGYDVELAIRIGAALNRKVELIPMSFGGLLAALQSGKADMVGGCLSVTEERAKSVDFAGSYYQSGIALLVRKETVVTAPAASISKCSDLSGKPVGTTAGTKFDTLLKDKVPGAIPQYFNNYPDQLWAMRSGKIAGFVVDEPVARRMTAIHGDLRMLPDALCNDQYAFLFPKSKEALRNDFNRILAEMRSSGMLKAMDKKWFSADDSTRIMPDYPAGGTRGVLTMAADTSSDPFTYLHKGKMLGLEVDAAQYIAARLGYKLIVTTPDLSTIIDAVNSGKVDFAACCISVTEERKKSMLFSDPHYDGGVVIITMAKGKAAAAGKKLSRWDGFKLSFERTFVTEDRYKLILDGLWVTILISVLAALLGTLLGFVVCMARRATTLWAVLPAKAFIGTLRGTPLLVILMILYYIVFASVNVNPIMIAVLGFSLNFAAYVSEMMRSGIDSVDKGQLEAASSLGFSRFQIFWKITFPHAARYVIPVYKGEFISMLKMTSVVGYIAIQDLTKMSDIIRSRTYEAFFPLLSTALIYFFLAYVMTAALGFIEVKIDPKRRRRIIKGVVTK